MRANILMRDLLCQAEVCNQASTEVNHKIPRRRGGTDAESNLQGMCLSCHSRKTAIEDGRWG